MNSVCISIVIPCYNSARFIGQTIEMLLQQDMSDCELILVNDGSIDNTLSILQEYESNPNIVILSQANQGVSVTRNVGLSVARGRYVYFLDSDDTLTEGTLKYFKQALAMHPNCQLFTFGYETRRNGIVGKRYVFPRFDNKEIPGRILTQSFLSKKICVNICSCIYERQFLIDNQFYFKEGIAIGEDILFLLQTMFQIDKAYYSQRVSFVYQIRDDSAMQGYKSYSLRQYNSHTLLRNFLLPIAVQNKEMSCPIHFFLLFSYLSNLRYYLKADLRSKELNKLFIEDGKIRYRRNFSGNVPYWLVMKMTMFIPIRLILGILK